MIRHRVPLNKLHPVLLAKIPQNPADSLAQLSDYRLFAVLRYKHDVIPAVPSYVRLARKRSRIGVLDGAVKV